MSKPHHRRPDGVDPMTLRAIGHPARRTLATSGAGPDAAPPQRDALRRAGHPWPATETTP